MNTAEKTKLSSDSLATALRIYTEGKSDNELNRHIALSQAASLARIAESLEDISATLRRMGEK